MKLIWIALPLLIIGVAASVLWRDHDSQPAPTSMPLTCADPTKGCAARLGGHDISVGLIGPVKPLQPFQAWVKAPGAKSVQAKFTMQGMDMGFNLYTLRADAKGVFRADVTLPMCVSGRRDWLMVVEIDGTTVQVPFSTDP